ncbi:MAG: glycine zipper domain-containing protein [Prevotella sp.]|nr:glycine zipper domain-containing protein [Prevotella sp.]
MKKAIAYSLVGAIMLSSCSTTESGASNGAFFGSILGSAIGGISGGPRGSDIGTIVGMAGGAIVGAAVGSAAEKEQQRKYDEYLRQRNERHSREYHQYEERSQRYDDSGFDPNNGGDDRIVMEPETPSTASVNESIQLRNVSFVDSDGNGIIQPGEECKVSFEIMNNSDVEIFDIVPTVIETTGNKHVHISPSVRVESIKPHQGVRYSAMVLADKRLKDSNAVIRITVTQGRNDIASIAKEFNIICTRK